MKNKKEKVKFIIEKLEELYPEVPIPLRHKDAYTLLVSVLLSAQCTDKRVNEITPILFKRADAPEKMIKLTPSEIEDIVRPCGLAPAKSKNIHRLSEILVESHGGQVPRSFEELEALPGIGHKSASVVMLQAFDVPAFPVDTHIHRLIHRWGLSSGKNVVETERDCKSFFAKELWGKLHLQIVYFGREHCPARGHDPVKCPICKEVGIKSLFLPTQKAEEKKNPKKAPAKKSQKEAPGKVEKKPKKTSKKEPPRTVK